jgi:iron complex outermembrane receptor protein
MEQAQTGRTAAFNIPSQPLGQALTAFGQQAGVQVGISAPAVAGKTSTAVSGIMTVEQALQRLLTATGVGYRFTSPNVVTVSGGPDASGAVQLDPVQVQGYPVPPQAMIDNVPPPYAGGQVATGSQLGLLGNRGVMDTPFNQTSYTSQKVQNQQAKTVRDALIDDPSVRTSLPEGSIAAENVLIRGFVVGSASIAYGGLYGMLPTFSIMPELAERVEVLKGPSAMLNGMPPVTSIGGTVNLVPKRAGEAPLTQLSALYTSGTQFGGHADVSRRFGSDKQFGVRFNGVYRSGQTDMRYNGDERALAVLGLDFRGERVRLSADLGYQYQNITGVVPYLGVNPGIPLPWAPNVRNNAGGQPWSYSERKDLFGVVRGEIDLTERVTAYASFGAHDNRYGDLIGGIFMTATNFNGNASATPQLANAYNQYLTGEVGVRARADTGPISHEIAVNATTYASQSGYASVNGPAYATNIYNSTVIARPNLPNPAANKSSSQGLTSFAIADTLSGASNRLQLTLGGRLQQVKASNFNPLTGVETSSYDQSALTPAVALVVKPWENVSIYGNFIQGLQQGAIVGAGFTNAGQAFAPYKSTQFEAGIKVDWGKLTTTASIFQISQPTALTDVSTNTLYIGGEQRNQGLELNFFGELADGVRVLGGAMFLNAVLTKTQGGTTDGWIAPFSPGAQFNLGGEWDTPFLRGLTLTGRILYTASQYFDTTFPRRSLPEWTRFDIGARYVFEDVKNPLGKPMPVALRFNVDNLLDANYWQGGQGGATTMSLGLPRTFRVALTADF